MMLSSINIKTKDIIFCSIIIVVMVLIDQLTKIIAFKHLNYGETYHVVPKVIDFVLVRNRGAVFGILQGKMVLFYVFTVIGLAVFTFLLKDGNVNTMPMYTVGLSLMIAGTIGNFIDRVALNYVRDFITFGFFDFPSFNVADMCMCVGIVAIFIDILFGKAGALWN